MVLIRLALSLTEKCFLKWLSMMFLHLHNFAKLQKRHTNKNVNLVKSNTGKIENGDIANIDFEGKLDGVAFEGGTSKAYDLNVGAGQFIPGFEEGLIGVETGKTVDVNVTFPKDYASKELAGKPVVFTVKVNSISRPVTPEYNLDFVKANSKFTTIEEYEAGIKQELLQKK